MWQNFLWCKFIMKLLALKNYKSVKVRPGATNLTVLRFLRCLHSAQCHACNILPTNYAHCLHLTVHANKHRRYNGYFRYCTLNQQLMWFKTCIHCNKIYNFTTFIDGRRKKIQICGADSKLQVHLYPPQYFGVF